MTRTRSQKQRAKAARQQQVNNRRTTVTTVVNKIVPRRSRSNAVTSRGRLPARQFMLSPCARKYLEAIENPFSGIVACVPTSFNQPSLKMNVYAKGTFSTGTTGFGCILVSPANFAWNYGENCKPTLESSAFAPILYTGPDFAGSTTALLGSTPEPIIGVGAAQSNSMFNHVPGTGLLQRARLVATGLRVRNVTPMLNRGGTGCMLETPNHVSTLGRSYSGIKAYPTSGPIDINGKWNYVTWHPLDEDEHDWYNGAMSNVSQTQNNTAGSIYVYNLACLVQAPGNVSQVYEYEVYGVYEIAGSNIAGVTATDSDPAGLGYVSQAFRQVQDRKPTTNIIKEVQNGLYKATLAGMQAVGMGVARQAIQYATASNNRPRGAAITYPGPIVEEMD